MHSFSAEIFIIGVNPFVFVPKEILYELFKTFGKDRGPIPVKGTVNGKDLTQTLVRYRGEYRLYVNGIMLRSSGLQVGGRAEFDIEIDKTSREVPMHPLLKKVLGENKKALAAFEKYPPSRQKEINRYLNNIKSKEILIKNIEKIVKHLGGEEVGYFVLLRNKKENS